MPHDERREKNISNEIREVLSQRFGAVVFTNPCGTGWLGRFLDTAGGITRLLGARRISFGLHPGSPDLVGWKSIRISELHVGKSLAVFVGIEVKAAKGRSTAEQEHFINRLKEDGALTGVARSVEDAIEIVNKLEV